MSPEDNDTPDIEQKDRGKNHSVGNKEETGNRNWWENPAWIIALAGLISALIGPVASGLTAYIKLQEELEIRKQELDHRIYESYFKSLGNPSTSETLISFISHTSSNPEYRQWATSQLDKIQERNELESQLANREAALVMERSRSYNNARRVNQLQSEINSLNNQLDSHRPIESTESELQFFQENECEQSTCIFECTKRYGEFWNVDEPKQLAVTCYYACMNACN